MINNVKFGSSVKTESEFATPRTMEEKVDPYYHPQQNVFHIDPYVATGSILGLGAWLGTQNRKADRRREVNSLPVVLPLQDERETSSNFSAKPQTPALQGEFYKDVKNVAKNLNVQFTPIGVIFSVKNKKREVVIDNIETSRMDEKMLEQWKMKNATFFKNVLLLKIYSEAKRAENHFAAKFVEKQQSMLNKKASELSGIDLDTMIYKACQFANTSDSAVKTLEKIATSVCEDEQGFQIDYSFAEHPENYSHLASCTEELGFEKIAKNSPDRLCNYRTLKRNLQVGFMPDRVLFVADNKLVGTLPATNMNEDGYEHFTNNDIRYFRNYFLQEAKKGIDLMDKTAAEGEPEKDLTVSDIFVRSDVHPLVYYTALTSRYGSKWFDFDPYALVKIIEDDFIPNMSINSVALNKILSIQTVNVSTTPFESFHAFEKMVRCFVDKPIDFLRREDEDIDIFHFVFSLDILERATPVVDVYCSLTPEVIQYIAQTLSKRGVYIYAPSEVFDTPYRAAFEKLLNIRLEQSIVKSFLPLLGKEGAQKRVDTIVDLCEDILHEYRKTGAPIDELVEHYLKHADEQVKNDVRIQTKIVLAVDEKLRQENDKYKMQLEMFNIGGDAIV